MSATGIQSFNNLKQKNSIEKYTTILKFIESVKLSHILKRKLPNDENIYRINLIFEEKNYPKKKIDWEILKNNNHLRELLIFVWLFLNIL